MHLFVNMKQFKLEEGVAGLSLDAWPVTGSVWCSLQIDGGEGAGVDLALGGEGTKCLNPLKRKNQAAERMAEREGGHDFCESMSVSKDRGRCVPDL